MSRDKDVIEAVVTAEWRAILDVPATTPDDDFFELGGNSLLAVAFVERVEERLGVELSLERFFFSGRLGALLDDAYAAVRQGAGQDVLS